MKSVASLALVAATVPLVRAAGFNLLQNWQGSDFFNNWSYYGNYDNLTNGDAVFVTQAVAEAQPQLTFINGAGNAIVRVDNASTVVYPNKRNTVRLQSVESYGLGSLWVMDAVHLPYGCSVWPAFWSQAAKWPEGEIDTLENVNLALTNQMALHTEDGCTVPSSALMTGTLTDDDCGTDATKTQGCTVTDANQDSYGAAFAAAGGGVYATLLADTGVYIWFFSRANVPSDLSVSNPNSSPNPDGWGEPSGYYPSSTCPTSTFFEDQFIILDITLCGDFAGALDVYNQTCGPIPTEAPTNYCYTTNVIGNGSNYDAAYFEVQYIRVWSNVTTANTTTGSNSTGGGSGSSSGSGGTSGKSSAIPIFTKSAALAALLGIVGAVALLA
ncbi:glycoside hydrolase family 16 protein [Calocera viscosa TUFC12733]|uniref:Glycoside hydrolase family 16 protein n=1 Tax=Calocera viscosa (strain TUFC12733) TaxID=1330018 RepID=A0A167K5G8_CALVF|nr:glycoside hydrolase family 16 protein [Calocera viscosa TUFC12733]